MDTQNLVASNNQHILAFVGMPGSGKSAATLYMVEKGIPRIRFGELTEETLKEKGLPVTPENERMIREVLRKEFGMAVYAQKAILKIQQGLQNQNIIAIDGLYSWEEYLLLQLQFPEIVIIHIYTERIKRYERLAKRLSRPLTIDEAHQRDIQEIEQLNKGGPIAIADFMIENDGDIKNLHEKIDLLLKRLKI